MPTLLSQSLLEETLTALPRWHGDATRIWREVNLSGDAARELREQVQVASSSMRHPTLIEAVPGGTRFVLSTPEVGGVSELDIALASHISDAAHRIDPSEEGVDAVRDPSQATFVSGSGRSGS